MKLMRCSVPAVAAAIALAVSFVLAGCTTPPAHHKPVIIDEPADAFNATQQPYAPNDGRYHGTLSTEIQRLQNARRLYELSQERQRNARQRRQRKCRKQPDSRRVTVQGTPVEFVYCEPTPNTSPDDVK